MRTRRDHRFQLWDMLSQFVFLGGALAANLPLTTDANCNCYRTNATTSNYFAHHLFFDFRNLPQYARVPPLIGDPDGNTQAAAASSYFSLPQWTNYWAAQNWNNSEMMRMNNSDLSGSDATVLMVNSPNNVYVDRDRDPRPASQTHLVMRTARLAAGFQTVAEIESVSTGFRFLSIRMLARTRGPPGAITAMFTYRPPAGPLPVQEADLEIRTRDPENAVQYTNQPSWNADGDIPAATRNTTMPRGSRWTGWAHYRLDWTPYLSTWYVNGQFASSIAFQAPRDPAQVILNSWSDGGSWSGNMTANATAAMQIQWIEMVFNNTDPVYTKFGSCKNVCSIDETHVVGTPVLMPSGGGRRAVIPLSSSILVAAVLFACTSDWLMMDSFSPL